MNFCYQFSEEEVRLLLAGLAKLPLEMSIALHQKIIAETQSQALQRTKEETSE